MVPQCISFSWQAQPKMNLGGFKFQSFLIFRFSGILGIVFVERIGKLLVFSTIRSVKDFGGQSIRTASGPVALILVPNGDLAKQIWSTFEKCRTFVGKGMGMWVGPPSNYRSWEGVGLSKPHRHRQIP